MGKTKNNNRSEVEFLRGEIRKLKSEIKRIRQENRSLSRKSHFYENIVVDDVAEEIEIGPELCKNCGKGSLFVIELPHLNIKTCDICEHRETTKKKNKK